MNQAEREAIREKVLELTDPRPIEGVEDIARLASVQEVPPLAALLSIRSALRDVQYAIDNEPPTHAPALKPWMKIRDGLAKGVDAAVEAVINHVEYVTPCRCNVCQAATAEMN